MITILVNDEKTTAYALRIGSEKVSTDYSAVTTSPGQDLVRESAMYSVIFEDYAFDFQLLPSFPLRMPKLSDIKSMEFRNKPEMSKGIRFPFPVRLIPYKMDFKWSKTDAHKSDYGTAGQGKMRRLTSEETEIVRKSIESEQAPTPDTEKLKQTKRARTAQRNGKQSMGHPLKDNSRAKIDAAVQDVHDRLNKSPLMGRKLACEQAGKKVGLSTKWQALQRHYLKKYPSKRRVTN